VPHWLDLNQISDWVSGAWWTYPLIFASAATDAFFPLVPSETVLVLAGNLASLGDLSLPLVILAGAAGAVTGDNISYGVGTWVGEKTVKRWFASEKWHRRLEWAERGFAERGAYIIVIARFLPGGRTAVTFSAGYVHSLRWRRFLVYDVVAGLVWATYGAMLGYVGGKTFENQPWKGLLLSLVLAMTVGLVIEAVRHWWQRRRDVSG
jgi:membrane-associated protein